MGGPEAEKAIRKALELRYRLIPYYYSLAHETYETGVPLMRPLVMEFPKDAKVADMTSQWMMGAGLMAAPILTTGSTRKVYFPDVMFPLEGGVAVRSGEEREVTAALDEIPVYVRAGTILPLGPVIQTTTQQPGGPLELRIYPGKDAQFVLVEDDGISNDYAQGGLRRTEFRWKDASQRLTWHRSGAYNGKDVFKALNVLLMSPDGKTEKSASLKATGDIRFQGN